MAIAIVMVAVLYAKFRPKNTLEDFGKQAMAALQAGQADFLWDNMMPDEKKFHTKEQLLYVSNYVIKPAMDGWTIKSSEFVEGPLQSGKSTNLLATLKNSEGETRQIYVYVVMAEKPRLFVFHLTVDQFIGDEFYSQAPALLEKYGAESQDVCRWRLVPLLGYLNHKQELNSVGLTGLHTRGYYAKPMPIEQLMQNHITVLMNAGGLTFEQVRAMCKESGVDMSFYLKEAKPVGISTNNYTDY